MKEESFNIPTNSYFLSDSIPPYECIEDHNFLSPQAKPENIFDDQGKDTSETQLSSIILGFPFTLDSYDLLKLKNKDDPELGGTECKIILGNLDKIRYNESILKLVFFSKDRKSPLKLNDYLHEMKSLTKNMGIEFISIYQNKLFIQCDNESGTNDAYTSLQKSSNLLDLLYDEERSINSLEEQNKVINPLFNSDKKYNNNEQLLIGDILLSDKKDNNSKLVNNLDTPIINNKNKEENYNFKEANMFFSNDQKNIWNTKQNNANEKIIDNMNVNTNKNDTLDNQKVSPIKEEKQNSTLKPKMTPTQKPPIIFPPQYFPPVLLPLNNLQKIQPQINPTLMMQIPKMNPFLLQTALAMQNIIKTQQLNQKNNEYKDKEKKNTQLNKIKNFNGKDNNINCNNNINNESEKYAFLNNNKESSTNSNTSSGSSKDSSPSSNYQIKSNINSNNNNNINFNIPNINFGLFNGININNSININTFQNINIKNNNNTTTINKEMNKNLKINDNKKDNNTTDSIKITGDEGNNFNLEQIVLNKKYKEYIPKNSKIKDKEKENDVEFHTNSTRDYQYKYVSRYIVQIENEKNFPVTKMIIGNNGKLLRQILLENCINFGDHTTKIRLRGRGSGYKEGPKNEESKDPMELCISSLNMISYLRCSQAIENLLLHVYYQYYLYQCNNMNLEKKDNNNNKGNNSNNINNNNKELKDKNGYPIIMKKILKYQYVVNRYNTLVKEEKRRKKEEELKNSNHNNM